MIGRGRKGERGEKRKEGRKKGEGKWEIPCMHMNYFHKSDKKNNNNNKTTKKEEYMGLLEIVDSTQESRKETSLLSFSGYFLLSIAM